MQDSPHSVTFEPDGCEEWNILLNGREIGMMTRIEVRTIRGRARQYRFSNWSRSAPVLDLEHKHRIEVPENLDLRAAKRLVVSAILSAVDDGVLARLADAPDW